MVDGAVSSRAVPGAPQFDVVVGDRFIAAIAAPAPAPVLAALAGASRSDVVDLESIVGSLPVGGVGSIESFALVWWSPGERSRVTAVVRGDAVVDVDSPGGSRRFDARGIRPWLLAEFDDVIALRLTAVQATLERVDGNGERVSVDSSPVRATAVEWSATDDEPAVDGAPQAGTDTRLMGVRRPARERVEPAVEQSSAPDGAAATEHAGGPPPEASLPRVRIGRGPVRILSRPLLIGRRPLPPRIVGLSGPAPDLVAVPSPHAIVSGTHLELRLEGARIVATDLRSTNGTTVVSPTGTHRLRAGESVVVAPGASLDLGDDTIIEILPPPGTPPG